MACNLSDLSAWVVLVAAVHPMQHAAHFSRNVGLLALDEFVTTVKIKRLEIKNSDKKPIKHRRTLYLCSFFVSVEVKNQLNMEQLQSIPASGKNSIEKIRCGVVFSQPLDGGLVEQLRVALDSFAEELPGHSEEVQVGMVPGNLPGIPAEVAKMLGRTGPRYSRFVTGSDGVIKWRVTVADDVISAECSSFETFSVFQEKLSAYIKAIIQCLNSVDGVFVREIGFHFIDRFNYEVGVSQDSYKSTELFKEDSKYLTKKAIDSSCHWHVFQGWFEGYKNIPDARVLHQLNIQNIEVNAQVKQLASIIEHRPMLQAFSTPIPLKDLCQAGEFFYDDLIMYFYDLNKNMLKDLLREEKLRQIGFEV